MDGIDATRRRYCVMALRRVWECMSLLSIIPEERNNYESMGFLCVLVGVSVNVVYSK